MSKAKYRYNTQTLSYERAEATLKEKLLRVLGYLMTGVVFVCLTVFFTYTLFESPKEKHLRAQNEELKLHYEVLKNRMTEFEGVLDNIQERDDNIYRTIFEAEPIPSNIRKAGIGGVNRYKDLENLEESDLVVNTYTRLDQLAKQLYIQSKSFDEVIEMARQKEKMLASIPAIQPISNRDLTRVASGFGYRIHPVYKVQKMHTGIDFTASVGTEIYSTGNGVVEKVETKRNGYGKNVVINHGYNYKTLYGHMSAFNVRVGQKVKRGDVIGYVGNTGTSTGPHLHYEVIKSGRKINPVNFFFNDLTPAEYELMIDLSSNANQSFD